MIRSARETPQYALFSRLGLNFYDSVKENSSTSDRELRSGVCEYTAGAVATIDKIRSIRANELKDVELFM